MRLRIRNPKIDPWKIAIPVGGVLLVGGAAWLTARLLGDPPLPSGTPAPKPFRDVPFAEGGMRPRWPVVTSNDQNGVVSYEDVNGQFHGNWARRFGAPRDGGRYHDGVDLYANHQDPVVAMESGTVVGTQSFNLGTDAILIDHGDLVALYGEVQADSWKEFGLEEGSHVGKGDPIARVGCQGWKNGRCSSHMLHFETYRPGTTKNHPWYVGHGAPPELLNPTRYLLRAAKRA